MKRTGIAVLCCFLLTGGILRAQDSIPGQETKWLRFHGYIKDLQIAVLPGNDSVSITQLLHNRLNFHLYPAHGLSAALEIRNQFFFGDAVRSTPGFARALDADAGYADLTFVPIRDKNAVLQTTIDRAWVDYYKGKWEVRAGRQRINWGKTLVWNPNDLFNALNYTDFDYQERPGSDALRVDFYPSGMQTAELAVKPGKTSNSQVIAGLYKFNYRTYDIQVLGALYNTDIAIGTGWAGNLGNAGFKGEATWFQPKDALTDSSGVLSATISVDYSLRKPVYLQAAVLYNTQPEKKTTTENIENLFTGMLSAKRLMPSEWSVFADVSANVTPLFTVDAAVIGAWDPRLMFLMPSLSYSIAADWDLTLVFQDFFVQSQEKALIHYTTAIFFRTEWSF